MTPVPRKRGPAAATLDLAIDEAAKRIGLSPDMPTKRPRGRPPLPPDKARTVTKTLRMTPQQAVLLDAWAIAANVPFSELATDALLRCAKRKRRPWE